MGTTEQMSETTAPPPARSAPAAPAQPEIQRLPTLALTSAGRALRVVAIVTLLAVLLGAAAAMRADRAGEPLPPRSADERAYLTLARDLALNGNYGGPGTEMDDPLHWPPGAPALFAGARLVAGGDEGEIAPGSVYSAQAVVGSLAVLAAFGAAALLAGPWAGLAAAAATAFYPPLVDATGRALSEPLGALALVLALIACVWAARRPQWWRFGLAGLALGGTLLVRADLAPALPLIAIWALLVGRRSAGWRGGALTAGALLAGTLIAIAPWVIHASQRADRLIPISTSGGSAIFVGTYLPGDGTMFGLKRALGNQMRLQNPRLGATPNFRLPQERLLDLVAARHPEMGRDAALRARGREERRPLRARAAVRVRRDDVREGRAHVDDAEPRPARAADRVRHDHPPAAHRPGARRNDPGRDARPGPPRPGRDHRRRDRLDRHQRDLPQRAAPPPAAAAGALRDRCGGLGVRHPQASGAAARLIADIRRTSRFANGQRWYTSAEVPQSLR